MSGFTFASPFKPLKGYQQKDKPMSWGHTLSWGVLDEASRRDPKTIFSATLSFQWGCTFTCLVSRCLFNASNFARAIPRASEPCRVAKWPFHPPTTVPRGYLEETHLTLWGGGAHTQTQNHEDNQFGSTLPRMSRTSIFCRGTRRLLPCFT